MVLFAVVMLVDLARRRDGRVDWRKDETLPKVRLLQTAHHAKIAAT